MGSTVCALRELIQWSLLGAGLREPGKGPSGQPGPGSPPATWRGETDVAGGGGSELATRPIRTASSACRTSWWGTRSRRGCVGPLP